MRSPQSSRGPGGSVAAERWTAARRGWVARRGRGGGHPRHGQRRGVRPRNVDGRTGPRRVRLGRGQWACRLGGGRARQLRPPERGRQQRRAGGGGDERHASAARSRDAQRRGRGRDGGRLAGDASYREGPPDLGSIDGHRIVERRRLGGHVHGRRQRDGGGDGLRAPAAHAARRDAGLRGVAPHGARHAHAAVEHVAQHHDALRPVGRPQRERPVEGGEEVVRAARRLDARQRRELVLQRTGGGRHRRLPGEEVVNGGAQAVQVRPGALAHGRDVRVLLQRREVRLQDGRERLRAVGDGPARGAEVEQHGNAVVADEDVVGRDVAVIDVLVVQQVQRRQQRVDDGTARGFVGRLVHRLAHLAQRAAPVAGHHHVGRAVVFPEPIDLDERGVVEARQHARLVHERTQAHGEGLGMRRRAQRHALVAPARRERRGHVFLQGHLALERVVPGPVDDAEAADAQHGAQLELRQPRADGQRVAGVAGRLGGGRRRGHRASLSQGGPCPDRTTVRYVTC